jgi:ABC-type dipeptide/oligopeptide/nickel transport system permease component
MTVQALIMMIALIYAFANFIVDILYPVLDPRVGSR